MKKALIISLLAAIIALPAIPADVSAEQERIAQNSAEYAVNISAEQESAEKISAEEKALCEAACFAECSGCSTPVKYLGKFVAHAYCDCAYCCTTAGNKTATGVYPEERRTVAVDPAVIPLGSKIAVEYEDGSIQEFIAEDTGSGIKGNIIDVYFESHEDAQNFGHKEVKIYLELD